MAKIKDTTAIAEKFSRVTPTRTQDYTDGVTDPRADWEKQTLAAEKNYEAAIQKSLQEKRFGSGVKGAGTEKWQRETLRKGPGRWAEGVAMAGAAYAHGFAPYADTIRGLTLPPRFPTGDPRNLDRVKAIAEALHKKKLAIAGRG